MLMRFSMGYGQALATPGNETAWLRPGWKVPSGSVQPYFSSSMVMRRSRGHSEPIRRVRQRSGSVWSCTTVSIIDKGAGSVAVSARPILPCTVATSGNCLMSRSVCCSSSLLLVTLMAGSVVGM
jgi:hypothetical protein